MGITVQGRAITFTAVNAGYALPAMAKIVGLTFQGTGLTAGQRVTVRDNATPGSGNILADYQTEAATDNADLWGGRQPQTLSALSLDNNTVAGTWVLTVFVLD